MEKYEKLKIAIPCMQEIEFLEHFRETLKGLDNQRYWSIAGYSLGTQAEINAKMTQYALTLIDEQINTKIKEINALNL